MDDVEEGATADAMQALTKKAKELRMLAASIRATTLDIEDAPLFRVLCLECKEVLATKAETLCKLINDAVACDNRDHMRDANRRYQRIADKLVEEPTSSEELGQLKEFAEEARSRRFEVLRCLHFTDTTRIMLWVVSLSSLSCFGPRRGASEGPR